MKTKFKVLAGCAVAAIATVATVNVSLSMKSDRQQLSDLQLANVEALAQESNNNKNPCKWKQFSCGIFSGNYEACITTGDGNTCHCGDVTRDC